MNNSDRNLTIRGGSIERCGSGRFSAAVVAGLLFIAVSAAIDVSVCSGAPEPVLPRYEIVDLGTLGGGYSSAYGINESGQVVGVSDTASGQPHAFVWDEATGMIDLGTLGGSVSHAYAINNIGQIVGGARTANNELHAFLWERGNMIDLGLLPVGSCTEATAINDAGQVAGNARTSANIYTSRRAFSWLKGTMIDLGSLSVGVNSGAVDINTRGQVVGTSGNHAFLWQSAGGMQALATGLPTSQGNAINDAGRVVLASSGNCYVWNEPDVLLDMNLVRYSRTNSINASGTVVGDFDDDYHAFLWDESSGMIDLNDVIPPGSEWIELRSAGDISDDGRIVGYGETGAHPGELHAFVMNPIPPEDCLVAHWELDESNGVTAADSAGNNDGVLQGDPQWQPYSGRMNGALLLDGSDDYVDCGNGPALNISDEITVAAWVTIDQVHSDWQTIVAKGDSAWRLSTVQDDMRFHFSVTGGPPWNYIDGDTVVRQGEWHHVCGTYDGAYVRLYVDGIEEPVSPVAESNGVCVNDYNVYIGGNEEKNGRYWDGLIDDVRVYNCPLTSKEVYALFLAAPIYVDIDVQDGDGSTWAEAFDSLQDALDVVQEGGAIHVAAGVYRPDRGAGVTPGDRSATFQLVESVSIKGGYAGFGEPSPKDRDYRIYKTTISGDLGGNDDSGFANMGENSRNVVTAENIGSQTLLEGFTITGGNAETAGGGGMRNLSASPVVRDCIFVANRAARGGGMYNQFADPTLINVRFLDNSAFLGNAADDMGGAGMYNDRSHPRLEDCLFADNIVSASTGNGGDGGAMYNSQSSPSLTNCIIRANIALRFGGGISSRWGGGPSMVNCVFNANSTQGDGGGLYLSDNDAARVVNCTFSQNSADRAGGLYSLNSSPVLVNCILHGNDESGGGSIENAQIRKVGGGLRIDYSCVEGLSGALGGEGNIGGNAYFVDPDGRDNIAGTEDDDLRIDAGSLCIDAGNNDVVLFIAIDLDGNPRIIRDVVDMGAYEFAGMLRWYVDGVNGNDNNNGLSPETAFATIQKGINSAAEGYTVMVLPGVYQEDLRFYGKAVTVAGRGDGATILESPEGYAVDFRYGEDANSVLRNVVIRNCGQAGILIWFSSPRITNVTIVANQQGIQEIGRGLPVISNSIFWANTDGDILWDDPADPSCVVTYSYIESGVRGWGNISNDDDPMFADFEGGDYHLLSDRGRHRPTTQEWILDDVTSPCVDAGDPFANPSAERMPNGGRLNMGAFGGTYYASMSEWPLAGDVNRDGVINMTDFAWVAESWLLSLKWAE